MTAIFEKTVGEIAAEIPASGRVFDKYHIDYCCGGKRRLHEACRLAGVDKGEIEAEILAVSEAPAATASRGWTAESLHDLIHYIVAVHHARLRRELPLLGRIIANFADVHNDRYPEILPLRRALTRLIEELHSHTKKEEAILFPASSAWNRPSVPRSRCRRSPLDLFAIQSG